MQNMNYCIPHDDETNGWIYKVCKLFSLYSFLGKIPYPTLSNNNISAIEKDRYITCFGGLTYIRHLQITLEIRFDMQTDTCAQVYAGSERHLSITMF